MILPAVVALLAAPLPEQETDGAGSGAKPPETGLAILCDPVKFRFSIRADATPADLDPSYPIAKIVAIDELFFAEGLPGWTNQIEVLGPLVRYERCGPYTFQLEGAAYNLYRNGESGAYPPFAELRILRGPRMRYPIAAEAVRMTTCIRTLLRARPCPDGYAVRIEGWYDEGKKRLHLIETRRSFEGIEEEDAKTETIRIDLEEDLDLWHPA